MEAVDDAHASKDFNLMIKDLMMDSDDDEVNVVVNNNYNDGFFHHHHHYTFHHGDRQPAKYFHASGDEDQCTSMPEGKDLKEGNPMKEACMMVGSKKNQYRWNPFNISLLYSHFEGQTSRGGLSVHHETKVDEDDEKIRGKNGEGGRHGRR